MVLPHGQAHVMGNGPPVAPMETADQLSRIVSEGLRLYRFGRGGEVTKLICGYMTCDPQLSRMLLAGLPEIIKINIRDEASGRWLEDTLRYSVDHAEASGPGGAAVVAKLSEALFVETLRRFISALPPAQTGWLAGVREPDIGKALAILHREPAQPWTIASLANEVGLSRSVLAERFRHYLKEPPIGYLTRWRMHLAARLSTSTSKSVAEVAGDVGYESEPSFNRAFKTSLRNPACPLSKLWQAAPRSITRCRRRPGQDQSKWNEKRVRGPRQMTVIALRFDVGPTISSLRGF